LADPACLDGMIGRIEQLEAPVDLLVNNAAYAVVGNLREHSAGEIPR
jgi:short-subunit dehydrogenase